LQQRAEPGRQAIEAEQREEPQRPVHRGAPGIDAGEQRGEADVGGSCDRLRPRFGQLSARRPCSISRMTVSARSECPWEASQRGDSGT
jgi:hypothetical protein